MSDAVKQHPRTQKGTAAKPWTIPAVAVDHYENFPVASWLCPPDWRPPIQAIYRFARTADDIADEGTASVVERQSLLRRYEHCLLNTFEQRAAEAWPEVFAPLAEQTRAHRLPLAPLRELLSAFLQDTGNPVYADRAELLDYCARSANPVGRLLLHLADVNDVDSLRRSDQICTALQLINFWQDLSTDLPRGRCYLPRADAQRHGITLPLAKLDDDAQTRALVRDLCAWARETMVAGAPLVHRVGGRFGWELRLVVQGGLRILDKIEALDFETLRRRPRLTAFDLPPMAWRACRMRASREPRLAVNGPAP
jgi:hydroxysqualene synthase